MSPVCCGVLKEVHLCECVVAQVQHAQAPHHAEGAERNLRHAVRGEIQVDEVGQGQVRRLL